MGRSGSGLVLDSSKDPANDVKTSGAGYVAMLILEDLFRL